jgi:hypothetical protein
MMVGANRISIWLIAIGLMLTSELFAQPIFHIGMTADDFDSRNPGILPSKLECNRHLGFEDTLDGLAGTWNFSVSNAGLSSAQFHGSRKLLGEAEFVQWVAAAQHIVADYTLQYGKPVTMETGAHLWDSTRANRKFTGIGPKKEVFHKAKWEVGAMDIELFCGFTSNRSEMPEDLPNKSPESYAYRFSILFSQRIGADVVKLDDGMLHLGMSLEAFAAMYPSLFPNGIQWEGQWQQRQKYAGINGHWTFDFRDGILNWVSYHSDSYEPDDQTFKRCRSSALQMITDNHLLYGNPDLKEDNFKRYEDIGPSNQHRRKLVWAEWKDVEGTKIDVSFDLSGGKSEPSMVVTMTFENKD